MGRWGTLGYDVKTQAFKGEAWPEEVGACPTPRARLLQPPSVTAAACVKHLCCMSLRSFAAAAACFQKAGSGACLPPLDCSALASPQNCRRLTSPQSRPTLPPCRQGLPQEGARLPGQGARRVGQDPQVTLPRPGLGREHHRRGAGAAGARALLALGLREGQPLLLGQALLRTFFVVAVVFLLRWSKFSKGAPAQQGAGCLPPRP